MKLSFESLKITAGKRLRLTTPQPHQGFTEMGLDIINQLKNTQTHFFTYNSLRRILECINFWKILYLLSKTSE